ncbi:MAG: nicotinamide mononucleotide transporter [Okeania sp. SIO2H7]|nr:nicotinamide mononucleotide transporter [Okeania sp. SIO2H7]
MTEKPLKYLIAIAGSISIFMLSQLKFLPVAIAPIESIAAITSAWSVWLLGKNLVIGWWVCIVGAIAYAIVFDRARLYGEVAIQLFYLVTSLQAIYIWLRGGKDRTEKPIERISRKKAIATFFLAIVLVLTLQAVLSKLGGAAPFWDALTTILSLTAHLYLMQRYLESWYIWILVDTIYVPLYASRELYLTSGLYAVFLVMAAIGLYNFRKYTTIIS